MISVSEAKHIITANIKPLEPLSVFLQDAAGYILAEEVYGLYDVPGFDQSAMDGYAIQFADKNKPLSVQGEMAAGAVKQQVLKTEHTIRIFTGAPVPENSDTVVMQEKVILNNGHITIADEQLQKGKNIRLKGSELKAGDKALPEGTLLTPGAIGFLAGIGINKVKIFPAPMVSVIVTGSELIKQSEAQASPSLGQVFESNSFSLRAALKQSGITEIKIFYCEDDLNELRSTLENALQTSDMVLITGGVSVGEYDYVLRAAAFCEVKTLFHKIKQKPGKPLYFGMKNNIPVFGLPGNPSSVLTCFYEYVQTAIDIFLNKKNTSYTKAVLANPFLKAAGLTHFLKGYYANGEVVILSAQESYKMNSFAHANCLVVIPEEITELAKGAKVELHVLPL